MGQAIPNGTWKVLLTQEVFEHLGYKKPMRTRVCNAVLVAIARAVDDPSEISVQEFLVHVRYVIDAPKGKELRIYEKKVPEMGEKCQEIFLKILKYFGIEIEGAPSI